MRVRKQQENLLLESEKKNLTNPIVKSSAATDVEDSGDITVNRYLTRDGQQQLDQKSEEMAILQSVNAFIRRTGGRSIIEAANSSDKITLGTNLRPISQLRDELEHRQRALQLDGPPVTMKNVIDDTGTYADSESRVVSNWFSASGGATGNRSYIDEARKDVSESMTRTPTNSFMMHNCMLWCEDVLPFLSEPGGTGERPCINSASKRCKAAIHLPHPESTMSDPNGRKMGIVLREFLNPIELDLFKKRGELPKDQHRCYICMIYENQTDVFLKPLSNKPVPAIGFHHATGEPGGYELAATLQPSKNNVDGRVFPVRHFSVDEYIPCVRKHPVTGNTIRGYEEVTRVFFLRGLPTATLQVASRGLAPFTESVARTERVNFTSLLLRQLRTTFPDDVPRNTFVFGSFKQLCKSLSAASGGVIDDSDYGSSIQITGFDDLTQVREFIEATIHASPMWERYRRPELRTHVVAHACIMRTDMAALLIRVLEQRHQSAPLARSRIAKQEARDAAEAIAKLREFERGHTELLNLIKDFAEHHQPYDDDTLLGPTHSFELNELGVYDPDAFHYHLTNADMSESNETAEFYRFPSPSEQLAEQYGDRIVLTVGFEGSVTARDIFADFMRTVEFVKSRGTAWLIAMRQTCGGFEDVVDGMAMKKQGWTALVRSGCNIIGALLLRVYCAQALRSERKCDCETAYNLTLFANTHLGLAEAVDWTDPNELVDAHFIGHNNLLEQFYPYKTCMMHEGSLDAHSSSLPYVGFFDTSTQQKQHKSWLHMVLKGTPRCCEVREAEGINKTTCIVDPPCGEWLVRCIEASLTGVMQHCGNRLPFPAVMVARRFVASLRRDDNLTRFICEHKVLCKHVIREHLLLLLKYNPVMRDILKLHCPWFNQFTNHVYAFMDRVRSEFTVSHELPSPETEVDYENDLSRVTDWNKHVYRWYKRTFPEAVVCFMEKIGEKLRDRGKTMPEEFYPSEAKCKFMRETLQAICGSGRDTIYTSANNASSNGRGNRDSIIERDCNMLARFGLCDRTLQIIRTLYSVYLSFKKRKRFIEQLLKFAPDEYALVQTYYTVLVDVQCIHQYNINSALWNNSVLDALCIKYDLKTRSEVPLELTTLVTNPCCKAIATQLAAPTEVKPAKLVSCATITYKTDEGMFACLGRKDATRRKPVAKKPDSDPTISKTDAASAETATTTRTRRPRRKTTTTTPGRDRDTRSSAVRYACVETPVNELRSYGKICVFTRKYREKRETAPETKHPVVLTPCCGTWMRYRHTYWMGRFQCLSCAIANGNDPTDKFCANCKRTGGGVHSIRKKTSRSAAPANTRTFSKMTVIDDVLVARARVIDVCSDCRDRLPNIASGRLPFLSEFPRIYSAGFERRQSRGIMSTPSWSR